MTNCTSCRRGFEDFELRNIDALLLCYYCGESYLCGDSEEEEGELLELQQENDRLEDELFGRVDWENEGLEFS